MACPIGKLVVDSKDPRINYNLLPGEKLLTCPYNLSHAVRGHKFSNHVLKCYQNHCKEQEAKNAEPLFVICDYDRSHHVRKEEIDHHKANCKARFDDGWGWDAGDASASASHAASSNAQNIVVELQSPQPIDEGTLKVIESTEEWVTEENAPKFDPNKRIHELRMSGYNVVKTHDIVGKSKSEKKAFYERERQVLKKYDQARLLNPIGITVSTGVGSDQSITGSCASQNVMEESDRIQNDERESGD